MLEEGDSLPEFEVVNQDGETVDSSDLENSVIFFYPKAATPGCTKEACGFRDNINLVRREGFDVFGVSTDEPGAQKKFKDDYDLNFDLLADSDGEVSEKFGVLKESGYAERTTFVVDNGEVEKVFRKVDPEEHLSELIKYLESR